MTKISKKLSKTRGEKWKDLWLQPCRAKGKLGLAPRRWLRSRKLHPKKFPNILMVAKWNLMNPQGNEWSLLFSQNTKTHGMRRLYFDDPSQSGSQIYSYASSDENSGCEGSSGQGMEKLETIPSCNLEKVRSKQEVILEAHICHLKNAELELQLQKYKGRVVARGDIVRDDSGHHAVFC